MVNKVDSGFGEDNSIHIRGARQHNLKNIDLSLPRNKFIVFTGVSGSGKSTLINELLHPALCHSLGLKVPFPQGVKELKGIKHIDQNNR